MKTVIKRLFILLVVLIPALIWGGWLARNYVLTVNHRDEIENMQFAEHIEELPEFDWYRVILYSETKIEIYYVNTLGKDTDNEYKIGGRVAFYKTPNGWEHSDLWNSVLWSGAGSADNYLWPYWHHVFLT